MHTLCFGEILLRLSPPHTQRFLQVRQFDLVYGGSEANVAVSLAHWGMEAAYLTRVPENELGHSALHSLAQFGVDTRLALHGGDRLGIYFLEQGVGRRSSKVLYDRAHSGMATLAPGMINWNKSLENANWLHWSGITPALSQSAADALLEGLEIARSRNITVSCDLNYRANLWKYGRNPVEIIPGLVKLTNVLLGDQTAFDICLDIQLPDTAGPETLLPAVQQVYPTLSHVAMTQREGFSASHNSYQGFLCAGKSVVSSQKYDLPDILDRIGTGDAFMAGLIFKLQQQSHNQDVVEFATAAAALKHYVAGDFNLSTETEVKGLMGGNSGGRVSR